MPREWHDYHAISKIEDENTRELYRSIVADKKPYFMRYIYPPLSKQYNTYIKNTNKNALREFDKTVGELEAISPEQLTERQSEFLHYYFRKLPVGVNDCVMNRICRKFEQEFDGYIRKNKAFSKFDYRFMRNNSEYSKSQYDAIYRLYKEYNHRLKNYMVFADTERVDEFDSFSEISAINDEFKRMCYSICPNRDALCNIILDICYTRSHTKKFAWEMCGSEIISNLLHNNENTLSFPVLDEDGDLEYCCNKFSVQNIKVEVN